MNTFLHGNVTAVMKNSCAVSLTNISSMSTQFLPDIIKKLSIKGMLGYIKDGDKRLQQAFLTLLNLYIYHFGEHAVKDIQEYFKNLFQHLLNFLEHGAPPILKSKS